MGLEVNFKLILWITDFLLNRTQQVHFNNVTSLPKSINTGALHKAVLFSYCTSLYINECRATASNHIFLKYTDDTTLVRLGKSDNSSLCSFEEEVASFIKWCSDSFLEVNVGKTKKIVKDFRCPTYFSKQCNH